ncbi:MAG: hypothetical protein AAF573_06690 [Bacteroidota bacterium]
MSIRTGGFGISPYLQELLCYVGQSDVFEQGSKDLEKLLRIPMNKKQVERVSKHYGGVLEKLTIKEEEQKLPKVEEQGEIVYAMIDGSMIFTRIEEWKEAKLGRLFKSKALHILSNTRNWIKDSVYIGHVGKHVDFLKKFELYTDQYDEDLVFVCDGAPWIWNWIVANYPKAIQILDYYHALQHLLAFALIFFKSAMAKDKWVEQQKALLWADKVEQVIENVEVLQVKSTKAKESKRKLVNYFNNNKERMRYGTFKSKGLLVGSGPIEAAHRTVIQKRLKLSGQRWTR